MSQLANFWEGQNILTFIIDGFMFILLYIINNKYNIFNLMKNHVLLTYYAYKC
jgi:hypothetical protein